MVFYKCARFIVRLYLKIFNRWRVEGLEYIPESGPAVLIGNHVSNSDPIVMACASNRIVHFMAKEEIFKIWGLKQLVSLLGAFPIKRGKIDRNSLRIAAKYLEDGEVLGIFPEGTRNKSKELGRFLPGASLFALRAGAPIIPMALIGSQRIFFGKITVRIGQPLTYPEYYGGKIGEEILDKVTGDCREQVRKLLTSV